MLNANAIKGFIKRKGMTQAQTALLIGMAPSTFWRKLRDNSFTLGEASLLIHLLDIEDPGRVFFGVD